MIYKYKKKPVEIEAIQFVPTAECLEAMREWGLKAVFDTRLNFPVLRVPTRDGVLIATEGDYIVKDVKGNFYPYGTDKFFDIYERAE